MTEEPQGIQFQLGQLTGQVTALVTTINSMSTSITYLEARVRNNEEKTIALSIKMAMLGIVSGAVGSFAMSLLLKHI